MNDWRRLVVLPILGLVAAVLVPLAVAAPAAAVGRISISNEFGNSGIDSTYSTKLTVSGSGFQSVKGGHGGVYVWFGTVSSRWQPSKGGVSGTDYKYVPDTESENNQGFQQYVAFPGSDTASSAAATMSGNGAFRVTLTVPGPTFKAVGRNGSVTNIDCRKVTCGVITIGAHGVKNANNETFTPVRVADLYNSAPGEPTSTDAPAPQSTDTVPEPGAPAGSETPIAKPGKPELKVDRTAAVAGRVLAFTASGLPAGQQVSVVFDDGRSGAGPFLVGANGALAGVITIPAGTATGTYELRLFGIDDAPSVKFAVRADDGVVEATTPTAASSESDDSEMWGKVFAGFATALFLVALARVLLLAVRRRRHAA